MLEIQRLRLQLPAGFERRGARISRLLAEQLAVTPGHASLNIAQLAPAPVKIQAAASDHQVAAAIARSITGAIANHGSGGQP